LVVGVRRAEIAKEGRNDLLDFSHLLVLPRDLVSQAGELIPEARDGCLELGQLRYFTHYLVDTAFLASQLLLNDIEPGLDCTLDEFERPLVGSELRAKLSAAKFVGKKTQKSQILRHDRDVLALQTLEEFAEQSPVGRRPNLVDLAVRKTRVHVEEIARLHQVGFRNRERPALTDEQQQLLGHLQIER
jgi:hypothetical protein